jgi:putative hydrolase of the HAD superfamily
LESLGLRTEAEPEAVARCAWDSIELAVESARAGSLEEPDYVSAAQSALRGLGLELDRRQAEQILDATYVSGTVGGKSAFPDARSTLEEFRRRGFKLAIVTNRAFGGDRFRSDLRETGLDVDWDAQAVSVEVGYLKPHPAMFEWVLDKLEIGADEALMVGDSLKEDVAGARALGIHTVWLRSEPDAGGVRPDHTVDGLDGLLDLALLRSPA